MNLTAAQLRNLTINLSAASEIIFTLDNGIQLELVEQQVIPNTAGEGEQKVTLGPPTLVFSLRPIVPEKPEKPEIVKTEVGLNGKPIVEKRAGHYSRKGSGW